MNLLELVIIAHRCRSTHHFIAFDALQLLKGKDSGDWKNLLLKHHTQLLKGAKAPDAEFKDFQNHVLHVEDGEWGGARDAAMEWYGKAVEALREKLRSVEMLSRNQETNESIEQQFREVMDQSRKVREMTEERLAPPSPKNPLDH